MTLLRSSLAMVLCGCGPLVAGDDDGGADTSADESSTDTTAGTSVGTATTAPSTMSTGVDTSTTSEPVTCASDWLPGCQSYCAALITCQPDIGTYEACVTGCIDGFSVLTPDCQAAWCEAYTCLGGLDCASLETSTPECDALGGAAESICPAIDMTTSDTDGECFGGEGGEEDVCELGCDDRLMQCDGTTCSCEAGGMPTGSCPQPEGLCSAFEKLDDFAAECCGW